MISQIIKAVMLSAAEAELGDLLINTREVVYIQKMLKEMGHKQDQAPMQTDNSMAEWVINKNTQPKRTKSMDMELVKARNNFVFLEAGNTQ